MRSIRAIAPVISAAMILTAAFDAAGQQARQPLAPADLFALQDIGEIAVSPDGQTVLFTVTTTDLEANKTATRLMRIASRGGEPMEVTGAPMGASSLRWSPDGSRVAFFAAHDGKNGVWTLEIARGQDGLKRIADYDRSNSFVSKAGNMLAWSPDGSQLAFAGSLEATPAAQDPVLVTRLQDKTRTALSDNRRAHIYVVPATGGSPRQVTQGNFDEHSIDWRGPGTEIVFLSNRAADPDAVHNYDIFAVSVASGAMRQITNTPGVETEPQVSPDGALIVYTATTRPITTIDSVAEDTHVWVIPIGGGTGRELNHALDRRSSSPVWSPDSRSVFYSAADRGRTVIYRVAVEGGVSGPITNGPAQAGPFSIARDGSIVFGLTDAAMPREIFRTVAGGAAPAKLTNLNTARVAGWRLAAPETLSFKSPDGLDVEGWLYPALNPRGASPMILSIHGGPHGMYGYGFNPAFQLNAARGYATLAINPRGSSGYGQAFSDGCVNDWGGGDYRDLMAGVDHVLKTHPGIDGERLGVTGSSYGGFMTNWVVTQTTRFKAAVSGASVSNLIGFYATSLYQDLVHAEFNGFPWDGDNFAQLWKWSPMAHVKNVTTPTLFIHGELDNDVHITQAEEMFTALRRRGVESALARYPREGHGFREPKHLMDRNIRTLEWMDKYLRETTRKTAP